MKKHLAAAAAVVAASLSDWILHLHQSFLYPEMYEKNESSMRFDPNGEFINWLNIRGSPTSQAQKTSPRFPTWGEGRHADWTQFRYDLDIVSKHIINEHTIIHHNI